MTRQEGRGEERDAPLSTFLVGGNNMQVLVKLGFGNVTRKSTNLHHYRPQQKRKNIPDHRDWPTSSYPGAEFVRIPKYQWLHRMKTRAAEYFKRVHGTFCKENSWQLA